MATVSLEGYLVHLIQRADRTRQELNKKKTMTAEIRTLEFWRSIIAECLGTFVYVFLVCGSHVMWPLYSINTLTKSFANGLAMATAAQCFGHVSGAHVNPAFTLAMLVVQKVTPLRAFLYITAQCGGSIAGAALLYGVTVPSSVTGGFRDPLGCTVVSDSLSPWQGLGLEVMMSFVVAFVMAATADPNRRAVGSDSLAVGLAYLVCTLVALPATGASMNPARSLGPAFVSNMWTNHWVYWAGPVIGSLLAALIYEYIFDSPNKRLLPFVRDREDSDRDLSDIKDDTDSKSSAAVTTPRSQVPPVCPQHQNQSSGPHYRPLTPYDGTGHRPHSRTAAATTPTVKYQASPGGAGPVQHQAAYYSTMPKGGYRSWNEGSSMSQFKF